MNVNLYSALGSHKVLSMPLYSDCFILAQAKFFFFLSFLILRMSHLLSDQLPGEHTGLSIHLMCCSASLYPQYGGRPYSNCPHMFFYVCQSNRHVDIHLSLFNGLGHSGEVAFSHVSVLSLAGLELLTQWWAAWWGVTSSNILTYSAMSYCWMYEESILELIFYSVYLYIHPYIRLLRCALNISWKDHATNEELYDNIPKISQKI